MDRQFKHSPNGSTIQLGFPILMVMYVGDCRQSSTTLWYNFLKFKKSSPVHSNAVPDQVRSLRHILLYSPSTRVKPTSHVQFMVSSTRKVLLTGLHVVLAFCSGARQDISESIILVFLYILGVRPVMGTSVMEAPTNFSCH